MKGRNMINFSKHSLKRMKSRNITADEIDRSIRMGVRKPNYDGTSLYDYLDLRLVISDSQRLITVFRMDQKSLFPRKDSRYSRNLYHRRKSELKIRDFCKEISAFV